jgi:hypothetical protein
LLTHHVSTILDDDVDQTGVCDKRAENLPVLLCTDHDRDVVIEVRQEGRSYSERSEASVVELEVIRPLVDEALVVLGKGSARAVGPVLRTSTPVAVAEPHARSSVQFDDGRAAVDGVAHRSVEC